MLVCHRARFGGDGKFVNDWLGEGPLKSERRVVWRDGAIEEKQREQSEPVRLFHFSLWKSREQSKYIIQ